MLLPFFFVSWMLLLGAGIVEALKHLSIKSLFLYIGAYFEWIHSTTTRQAGTILYPAVQCLPMCSRHFDSGMSGQVKPALRTSQAFMVPCWHHLYGLGHTRPPTQPLSPPLPPSPCHLHSLSLCLPHQASPLFCGSLPPASPAPSPGTLSSSRGSSTPYACSPTARSCFISPSVSG